MKDVQVGMIFHPFKSSTIYYCIEIIKLSEMNDPYYNKKTKSIILKVLSININTNTVKSMKKEFPFSIVRGMSYTSTPVEIKKLSNTDLFNKIFN